MNNYNVDLEYLRARLQRITFVPYPWDGEDKNIGAFRSKEELIAWYCQPPGVENQPYRDRGFYTRELAYLSRTIRPRAVVEFGTSLGIGTCLLHWLNPDTILATVDINFETFMPGDKCVPMGYLARHQGIQCGYVHSNSCDYVHRGVDLCFIDADHSYEAVALDSERAWGNKSTNRRWTIVWHDYNDRHSGVMDAVNEFCAAKKVELQSRPDSDTVWITGGDDT